MTACSRPAWASRSLSPVFPGLSACKGPGSVPAGFHPGHPTWGTQDPFVDRKLRRFYADCQVEAKSGAETGYLYQLVEHQSAVDPLLAFRIWHSIFLILDRHARIHKSEQLPLVWPLLLYSGRNAYPKSTGLRDLILGPKVLVNLLINQPFPLRLSRRRSLHGSCFCDSRSCAKMMRANSSGATAKPRVA